MNQTRQNESQEIVKSLSNFALTKPLAGEMDVKYLARAAKLYLEGTVGDAAYTKPDRPGFDTLMYRFEPNRSAYADTFARQLWPILEIIFGCSLVELTSNSFPPNSFVAYLLTTLCADVIDPPHRAPRYNASECRYVDTKSAFVFELSKSIDHCSYHKIKLIFVQNMWTIAINGCWSGSQQDPGPVNHPDDQSYTGQVAGYPDGVSSVIYEGMSPHQGFALWGIDASRLVVHQDTATA